MNVQTNETIEIARLGHDGDGLSAETPPQIVPLALPGERWRRGGDGAFELAGAPSADRIAPACRHFGRCGGCVAQHIAPATYATWKTGIVEEAFRQARVEAEISPLVRLAPGTRRRAVLSAVRAGRDVQLGFHERRSDAVVVLEECPVATSAIVAALPALRRIAGIVMGNGDARVTALDTRTGLDVAVATQRAAKGAKSGTGSLSPKALLELADIAHTSRISRIALDDVIIVETVRPTLTIAGQVVVPAPGMFVQATADAEKTLSGLVVEALGTAKRVVDLFAGIGTFSLAVAARARVLAVDSEAPMLAALEFARRQAQGLKPIETLRRDLLGEPLSPLELAPFDAVVLDPPRAGAKAQVEQIAKSKVKTVAYVSCNPATLARDARILVDAGFTMGRVTPIDQFLWSPHVEAMARFRR